VIHNAISNRSEFLNTIAGSNFPKENFPKQPHANCQSFKNPSTATIKNNEQLKITKGFVTLTLKLKNRATPNNVSIIAMEYTRISVVE